jgi:4-diphosphocytidyl-2-C-methyl-D-erythritol kinase
MTTVSILAPAKINLYLNVAGKRPNGYHDIESVMQSVSLFDKLTVTKNDSAEGTRIALESHGIPVPSGEGNLIYRAAELFFEATSIKSYDISFYLEKNIPTEAGLGGGSSDAAAAIIALDRLYETGLTVDEMCAIGVKFGADIPFCIKKGTVTAEGIGEIMNPIAPMPKCKLVVGMPKGGKVSTAEAYRKIDAIGAGADIPFADFLDAMKKGDLTEVATKMYNKFELATPEETGSLSLVRTLLTLGAIGARMSGSGASVFGVFPDEEAARAAFDKLPDDMQKFICEPISENYEYFI